MGYLFAYNYTSHEVQNLPACVMQAADLQSITDHSVVDIKNGTTWSVVKSGNSIQIGGGGNISFDADNIEHILDICGISNRDVLSSDVITFPDADIQAGTNYGFNSNFTARPYFSYVIEGNFYTLSLYPSSSSHSAQAEIGANRFAAAIYAATNSSLTSGALGIIGANFGPYNSVIDIYYDPSIVLNDIYGLAPGGKGFRPTAARTTKDIPGNGGRPTGQPNKKDPDYASDTIAQPGAPDESVASAIGSGFLTCYKITPSNLELVGKNLYSETLLDIVKNITVNPLDFIVSLMIFPCSPAAVGSSTNIKLGGWLCAAAGGGIINALGTAAVGAPLSKQFAVFDFGTVSIDENFGSFLDYSQTTVELYLPFIGSVNIDVSECMGGSINVQYTVDFFTGMCVANVLCQRSFPLPSGKLIPNRAQHSYQGNCAIQIPLSAINYGSMIGSLINACTQGITNPVSGFVGMASDAVGGGFRPNVSSKGNIVANSGFCSVLYPYVRITRPITAEPYNYQEVMGYPSYINDTLGQCEGLCICDDIDLKGVAGATESELNKIRQYCKDGVYI